MLAVLCKDQEECENVIITVHYWMEHMETLLSKHISSERICRNNVIKIEKNIEIIKQSKIKKSVSEAEVRKKVDSIQGLMKYAHDI